MRRNNISIARQRNPVGEPVIIERVGDAATIYRTNGLNPVHESTSMETVYDQPRPVYFLNDMNEHSVHMREYIRKSGPYIKTFRLKPGQVLRLVDMSQPASRAWVASMMSAIELESLNRSFPLRDGIVGRVSGEEEEAHDLIVMTAICEILKRHPVADGYYSAPQPVSPMMPNGFHAEIGLCPTAFSKFIHVNTKVGKVEGPPRVAGQKRSGTRRNNRQNTIIAYPSNNNSGLASPPRPFRQRLGFEDSPIRRPLFESENTPVRKSLFNGGRKCTRRTKRTKRSEQSSARSSRS